MEAIRQLALEHKPKLIVCGYSAYPRTTISLRSARSPMRWCVFAGRYGHIAGPLPLACTPALFRTAMW